MKQHWMGALFYCVFSPLETRRLTTCRKGRTDSSKAHMEKTAAGKGEVGRAFPEHIIHIISRNENMRSTNFQSEFNPMHKKPHERGSEVIDL